MSILTRVQALYIIQKELSECNEDMLVPSTKELLCVLCCNKFLGHNVSAQHSIHDVGLRKFQFYCHIGGEGRVFLSFVVFCP